MNAAFKQKLPLLFLLTISLFWAFYYQSHSFLNDFGRANYEWFFMIDGLLVLPLLCFWCIKDKKQAAIKASLMGCLVVLVGSYIIPESSKVIWPYLESGRYLIVAVFVLFEIVTIATVFLAIKASLKKGDDPDVAISRPIERYLGAGKLAQVIMFEARMWTYALFSKNINKIQFKGDVHFSYHNKDGAQSNLKGFVLLILFEIPLMHVLLHFIWSPMAANVATLLTLFGLVFFTAEYRAISRRPISLTVNQVGVDELIIRYGLFMPMVIPVTQIASIEKHNDYVPRSKRLKRYNYAGNPNIIITLNSAEDGVKTVYLGVDHPVALIDAIKATQPLLVQ